MALCHNKQYENYYCHLCRQRGQFAVRVAGSGASSGACCDVITVAERTCLVEVKATKEPIFRLTKIIKEQLEFLREQHQKHLDSQHPNLSQQFKDITGNMNL